MAWERITQWEIEERPGCVVLTLRGGGSVTPLLVQGLDASTTSRRSCGEVTDGSRGPGRTTAAAEWCGRTAASRRRGVHRRTRRPRPGASRVRPGRQSDHWPRRRRLEGARHRRAARRPGHGRGARAAAERRRSSAGASSAPAGLSSSAHPGEEIVLGHVGRARRGSAPGGTRRRDGCRASPRAAGRTRTASWGRPGWHAPSAPRRAPA